MTPKEFRREGRRVVDWIARYMKQVQDYPVLSQVEPGAIRAALPASPPQEAESFSQVLRDFEKILMPGITHWQSPGFFGYFPANNSGPSILGELLAAGLGVQGMLWSTSPACTELETQVLDWMAQLLGLPDRFHSRGKGGGVIQDSASSSILCALLAARERVQPGCRNQGTSPLLTAYASNQTHSSLEKSMMIAGMGRDRLRLLPVDSQFALRPEALDQALREDRDKGYLPCFVCITLGTTSSNAIDPLPAIAAICARHGVWLHVDAAMCGSAAICPEFRPLLYGDVPLSQSLELVDSYNFNAHKWLFVNFDCSCFWVADRGALIQALSVLPEYLRNQASESGQVIDYRDWQIPLGRRFRSLKLWFVLRCFGVEKLQRRIRKHITLAREFATWVAEHPHFELVAPVPLSLVCFRHEAGEERTQQILERVNREGSVFLTHTRLNGCYTLRLSVGQTHTRRRHVKQAWRLIRAAT